MEMTNKEAVDMIENDLHIHHDSLSGKYRHALRMAINALKQLDDHREEKDGLLQ